MSKSATSSNNTSRWRKYSSLLFNGALMVVAFLGISAFQARNMLGTGRVVAPALQAQTLAGEVFDLSSADARPTLIYFFAPWCHYCALSSNNLLRLRRLRDEENLRIITVALDWQSVVEVREYAKKHELNVPVLIGDANTARDWKVYGFPTYYVLDSQHRIAKRDIGYSTQLGLWWRTWSVN